jgi:rhamnosyltransferase
MNIEIICPLYNAEKYIENLDSAIKTQKNVDILKVNYVLTRSKDMTEEILKKISANYSMVEPEEFSHSLVRENVAMKSNADILVFITQDVEIRNENWLEELVKPIIENEAEASFSRQLTKYDNIEKYTREKNYPDESYIVSKNDIASMGLRTFFFSDASSAIKTSIFKELKGYDNKNLPISEDMYIAYKIIMNDYKIKYCANSIVYHSHKFTLKQLYNRYYDTGKFFKQENYLDKYGTNKSGGGLAKYILKRAIQEKNIKVLLEFLPNMAARFIGMKMGR